MNKTIFSKSALQARQARSAELLKPLMDQDTAILVFSGSPLTKPGGLDQQYSFLPLPEYYWLSGSRRPWGAMLFHLDHGWVHFQKPVSQEEIIWEGESVFQVDHTMDHLENYLKKCRIQKIAILGQGPQFGFELVDADQLLELKNSLDVARRPKDAEEIQLIKKAANAALFGYQKLQQIIVPGISERKIQVEYEAEVQRHGSQKMPYDSIVGCGTRSAVLHAIPTEKIVQAGDLVLVDAGADIEDYCVDITRVFFADKKPNTQQKNLFEIVEKAHNECIKVARPGVEWHEVHLKAMEVIGQGLIDLEIIKGSLSSALESGAVGLFFPHGVGHMVGQRVRDVGGHLFGRPPRKVHGSRVRVDLPLEENFLMTIEPGCYFIEALLRLDENQRRFKDLIHWNEVDKWMSIGGIRLEDDVLIRKSGNENLTQLVPIK